MDYNRAAEGQDKILNLTLFTTQMKLGMNARQIFRTIIIKMTMFAMWHHLLSSVCVSPNLIPYQTMQTLNLNTEMCTARPHINYVK